jgi:hypothetical protein
MSRRGKRGNTALLVEAAKALRPVLDHLVFGGGCATALLITDEAAGDVRPTYDVDAVLEAASYSQYTAFSEKLRKLRFSEDTNEDAPICRWRHNPEFVHALPMFLAPDNANQARLPLLFDRLRRIASHFSGSSVVR